MENFNLKEAMRFLICLFLFLTASPALCQTKVPSSMGTAFFVNDRNLITNYHVVKECAADGFLLFNNVETPVKIVAKDSINDLAVLELKNNFPHEFARIETKPIVRGDSSYVYGFPMPTLFDFQGVFTAGMITSLHIATDQTGAYYFSMSTPLNHGNSGGALVNKRGGVIGVTTAITEFQGANFSVYASSVIELLKNNNLNYSTIPEDAPNLTKQMIAEKMATVTGIFHCRVNVKSPLEGLLE
jgi:S1-C subfamily serine protease